MSSAITIKNLKRTKILGKLLVVCNAIVLLINLFVGSLVYQNPLIPLTDLKNVLSVLLAGTLIAFGLFSLYGALLFIQNNRHFKFFPAKPTVITLLILLPSLPMLFSACTQHEVSVKTLSSTKENIDGKIKDATTGLETLYHNLKPTDAVMSMNGETINHTDIPIGESFMIINEGISGLVSKEGKISVGCSLQISDEKGNTLLSNPDLFAAKDPLEEQQFKKEDVTYLRCTVNTGLPMQSEEQYLIKAVFWDKNGDGQIVNSVRIRAIDMP